MELGLGVKKSRAARTIIKSGQNMKITEKMPPVNTSGDWHLRVYAVKCKPIEKGAWRTYDVCSPFWRFYANNRDGMEMELLDSPAESKRFVLKAGHCYFVPPGVRFSGHAHALVHHFYIHFDVLGAPPLHFPAFESRLTRPMEIPTSQALDAVKHLANECWSHDNTTDDLPPTTPTTLRAKSLLFDALAVCLESWPCTKSSDLEWLRPVLEHIERHLQEPLTNAQLATLCHFCPDYFIVRFRAAIGQTPGQYLLARRLAVAAQQLLFSGKSIEFIAAQTGFCDRFHFSRTFKNHFGISPVVYRKNRPL